ncbi:RsmD family RNA methyltransferase [Longimicrobium sp.]|jgi:16S rRNA (guanine966-N2)-methyltransferase|uniref:RsmD family RNA methyltransferase n=1 Tax=Longimicrobium sp. TaxID=2029185 RepID=UPI002ED8E9C0
MRIIGGKWAGRHLMSPPDKRVRPTAEHVRQEWLRLLEPKLKGARVIDLFAGTGALGLEAMSRGAATADFVETRPASVHALKANIAALHVRERSRLFKKDALPFAEALEPFAYDIAFADPPYGSKMLDRLIETWQQTPFASILAVEHAIDHELPGGGKRVEIDDNTALTFYRARPFPQDASAAAE